MMKVQKNHLEGLIALLLFGIFAVCILMVLLTGANTYRSLTDTDQVAYDNRTCIQYIATQVRRADSAGSVSLTSFGGRDALSIAENIEGETYVTLIYLYDGYLTELFCSDIDVMSPEDGEQIMKLAGLEFTLADGVLDIVCENADDTQYELSLTLRSSMRESRMRDDSIREARAYGSGEGDAV